MAKRMLIDAAHPEETRVVVLSGNRLDEFDFETSTKKQIKGNIYLAKVTRVEPSLQAAFVDFGGNRHGFLAFSEIHPDYFRIPVADRERIERMERRQARAERQREERVTAPVDEEERSPTGGAEPPGFGPQPELASFWHDDAPPPATAPGPAADDERPAGDIASDFSGPVGAAPAEEPPRSESRPQAEVPTEVGGVPITDNGEAGLPSELAGKADEAIESEAAARPAGALPPLSAEPIGEPASGADVGLDAGAPITDNGEAGLPGDLPREAADEFAPGEGEPPPPPPPEQVDTLGDGDAEVEEERRRRARLFRHYKIQEVIKRRQIMLVQVTKEERGNKGAALTTYLSLAGRYCVLMPNTPRSGGVSRKITSASDRRRLKELVEDLEMPEGMGVIVRTAGSERTKPEIKRDFDYLLRLWEEIREVTFRSTAPALIYEEGNLIKRSIRDLYQRDVEEVLVDGDEGYRTAKAFMKMLMPSHARRVQPYRDPVIPLFQRFQVESQIDAIHSHTVQLRSGGYIVINPTEALVAIDVNSGRSTRERNIEETALRTNLEAADEVARQLRLRDLAGLIVIDFIDMEEHRNQVAVERRLKEAMKHDRARIQIGRISPFGLLELSRQRLRPSLIEASTQPCQHCHGTGVVRSTESSTLSLLRAIEEEGVRRRSAEIAVAVPTQIALYLLNQKRDALIGAEQRYGFRVRVDADDELIPPAFRLERERAFTPQELANLPMPQLPPLPVEEDEDEAVEEEAFAQEAATEGAAEARGETDVPADAGEGRRRRRRRGRHDGEARHRPEAAPALEGAEGPAEDSGGAGVTEETPAGTEANVPTEGDERPGESESERRRRRRGRRGGRRRRREPGEAAAAEGRPEGEAADEGEPAAVNIEIVDMPPPETSERLQETLTTEPLAAASDAVALQEAPIAESGEALPEAKSPPDAAAPVERAPMGAEPEAARPVEPVAAETIELVPEAATPANLPQPRLVSERPANPRRGWWRRS